MYDFTLARQKSLKNIEKEVRQAELP